MSKSESTNAEPVARRAMPHPLDEGAAEPRYWDRIVGVPRSLLITLPALALGGMVLWGMEKETAQLDFQLLVSALRASTTANCAAAVATTALSYLALAGYVSPDCAMRARMFRCGQFC